jgi:hypothetical protein
MSNSTNTFFKVFLRILESYSGIMFLTANRVGDLDKAFASRVHMSLYYPQLDLDSTIAVFNLNITRIRRRFGETNRRLNVEEVPITAFMAEYWRLYPKARWNGRQIRNTCQAALALAELEAQGGAYEDVESPDVVVNLEVKHFKKVADIHLEFTELPEDIDRVDADKRARETIKTD